MPRSYPLDDGGVPGPADPVIPAEEYLARIEAVARTILTELEQLPDGPERQEMERLLREMRGIAEVRFRCTKLGNNLEKCNEKM